MRITSRHRSLVASIALVALLAVPAAAQAVLGGTNGRIVFVSGRGGADGNDTQAKIYFRTILDDAGTGTVEGPRTSENGQYRHPTWSPDRKKIAYARSDGAVFDVFVHNLVTGQIRPISDPDATSDRPAWSPDGTRIAYESGTGGSTDILVYTLATGRTRNLTDSTSIVDSKPASKPAWTPNSKTIYYTSGSPFSPNAADIVREPARGGSVTPILSSSSIGEFQPSISPDGKQICFTRGAAYNDTADVYVAPLANTAAQFDLSDNATGDYNCTWSPDGTKVAYVRGTFTSGALVMENADDTSSVPVVLADDALNFDGNPDWAPDARPRCRRVAVEILRDSSVVLPLRCADRGPAYERSPVSESIVDFPERGSLGPVQQGTPARVRYTASDDIGTDRFTFRGVDASGPGPKATATVEVLLPGACGNFQRGGGGADTIVGTRFGDLLRGLGGGDDLRGLAGDDCLEGANGNDRLDGGRGSDLLTGGTGLNRYLGGPGNDRIRARNDRADVVQCGQGTRDRATVDFGDAVTGCERVDRG